MLLCHAFCVMLFVSCFLCHIFLCNAFNQCNAFYVMLFVSLIESFTCHRSPLFLSLSFSLSQNYIDIYYSGREIQSQPNSSSPVYSSIVSFLWIKIHFSAIGGFLFGYDTGVVSGAMEVIVGKLILYIS